MVVPGFVAYPEASFPVPAYPGIPEVTVQEAVGAEGESETGFGAGVLLPGALPVTLAPGALFSTPPTVAVPVAASAMPQAVPPAWVVPRAAAAASPAGAAGVGGSTAGAVGAGGSSAGVLLGDGVVAYGGGGRVGGAGDVQGVVDAASGDVGEAGRRVRQRA